MNIEMPASMGSFTDGGAMLVSSRGNASIATTPTRERKPRSSKGKKKSKD